MSRIELRTAVKADIDTLVPLVRAYHRFEDINMSDEARTEALSPILGENPHGRIWLITCADSVVGYIALCFGYSIEFGGRDAFVDEFFIQQQFRGRGIGGEVLSVVKSEAAALGILALHLEVAGDNDRASILYSKAGFSSRDRFHLMSCALRQNPD